MAHDVTSLLDELGVRDATLIGISVGGLIALRAGLDRPELFRALVVCDASARIGSVDGWNERIAAVHEQGLAGMRDLVLGRWFAPDFENAQPAAHRGYGEMLARCPDAGYVATCAALRDEDLRARLADLDLPVRVLCGALDASTPPDVARELASALPRGSFREIAGAGHLPCAERPLETAHEIGEFVQEIVHG